MEGKTSPKGGAEFYVHDIHQTHYPYINLSESTITPALTKIRRSIASFNPFAYSQVPSQDRMALGLRYGNKFYFPDLFPNYVTFQKWFPTHYDPLASENFKGVDWSTQKIPARPYSHFAFTVEKLPRACVRTIQTYKRCQMVNGDAKCKDEAQDILEICPNWALDAIKERTRWTAKVSAMQNIQYFRAMEVSPYNKGRSVTDVPDKTWIDGTRLHLRPDTMWADERYSKITQAEINEAKKRVQQREAAKPKPKHEEHPHYDFKHIERKTPRPLYP